MRATGNLFIPSLGLPLCYVAACGGRLCAWGCVGSASMHSGRNGLGEQSQISLAAAAAIACWQWGFASVTCERRERKLITTQNGVQHISPQPYKGYRVEQEKQKEEAQKAQQQEKEKENKRKTKTKQELHGSQCSVAWSLALLNPLFFLSSPQGRSCPGRALAFSVAEYTANPMLLFHALFAEDRQQAISRSYTL